MAATNNLSIDQATYGRSESGTRRLVETSFVESINKLRKVLSTNRFNQFHSVVVRYWAGNDAGDFLNKVDKTRQDILKEIEKLEVEFKTAIEGEAKEFKAFQEKNRF